jgi:hypothetical protein
MKQEGSRSNSATSNRPSKWSNATHNNNRGCRRGNSRRARIRRLSRRRKSLNNPLAAATMRTLKKSRLEAGATKRARRAVPLHGREHRAELACGEVLQDAKASRWRHQISHHYQDAKMREPILSQRAKLTNENRGTASPLQRWRSVALGKP